MEKLIISLLTILLNILLTILLTIVLFVFGWLITCGIIYLITLCFGLQFKWIIATGIWLVIFLIKLIL